MEPPQFDYSQVGKFNILWDIRSSATSYSWGASGCQRALFTASMLDIPLLFVVLFMAETQPNQSDLLQRNKARKDIVGLQDAD